MRVSWKKKQHLSDLKQADWKPYAAFTPVDDFNPTQ